MACAAYTASTLRAGDSVWLVGERYPAFPGLRFEAALECLQMILPECVPALEPVVGVVGLTDAAEMVALTDTAFPGFFRHRTCEMGSYFGVRDGGERLMFDGYAEISGGMHTESTR